MWLQIDIFMNNYTNEQINFQEDTMLWNKLRENPIGDKHFICLVAYLSR